MSVSGLGHEHSVLVKRTRMEWETMSTPDLADQVSQLAETLEDATKSN